MADIFPEVLVSALDRAAALLREAAEMREALEHIAGVTIISEGSRVRPDAASYKTPSEFHVYAQVLARAVLNMGEE